ncbi:hypothetical protein MCEMSEM23_02572 [Rhabdaerophilaceae bacterium]
MLVLRVRLPRFCLKPLRHNLVLLVREVYPMRVLAVVLAALTASAQAQERIPLFDAHVHYSHDAVELIPPAEAVAILRQAGLRKALVSSSDDEGTQKLLREAPDLIVPSLRPYRNRNDTAGWTNDPAIITYVEDRLSKYKYQAIGEFHAYGADIEKPVVQRMIALARQYRLMLHAHSDADAIDRIFKSFPEAIVLWAHSGFERPERVREMLRKHRTLWADLAFRNEHASGDVVAADWKAAFEEFPDRFMVGTDTFTPERWHYIGPHAQFSRRWLASLPGDLAERIAYRNAEAMLLTASTGTGAKK